MTYYFTNTAAASPVLRYFLCHDHYLYLLSDRSRHVVISFIDIFILFLGKALYAYHEVKAFSSSLTFKFVS